MAKIGIVGTGWGARVQAPTFREAGLTVSGIAGHRVERTRQTAHELDVNAFEDWRALVADKDIDLISIVTPPSEHLEMALAALAAGKHVLLEKPTALNAGEAEQLVDAAREHPRQLTLIDHELRFLPSWREAKQRIAELGDFRYAEVRYSSPARGNRTREWNWWSDADRGGGIWGAVGSHFVDALRYFGVEFEEAFASMRTTIAERPHGDSTRAVTSDDLSVVNLRTREGATAMMTFSVVSTGPDEAAMMTMHGERGAMRFAGEEVFLSTGGEPFTRMAGAELEQRPGNSPGGAFGSGTLHLGHALKAALDDGDRNALAPAATFDDGLMQQRVLDAARASSSGGGWVRI